jgi:hypothetical protein
LTSNASRADRLADCAARPDAVMDLTTNAEGIVLTDAGELGDVA